MRRTEFLTTASDPKTLTVGQLMQDAVFTCGSRTDALSGHPTLKDIRLPGKGALDALLVWKLCLNGHCGAPAFLYRIILRGDKEDGRGGLVSSLCSRNARSQKGETGSLAISCSRNAHARKVLVRRAHSGIDQAPLENQKGELGRRAQWKINQSLSLKRQ